MENGVFSKSGEPLIKMWDVKVGGKARPFRNHSHLKFEISLFHGGTGKYHIGGREYGIKKDDMFIIPSGEVHCFVYADDLSFTNLQFEPKILSGNSVDSLSSQNYDICFKHAENFSYKLNAENNGEIRNLFNLMYAEAEKSDSEFPLCIKSYLNLMLVSLIRNYGFRDGVKANKRNAEISAVMDYIERNFTENISLNKLSEIANLSPNYLSKVFYKSTGILLWDYIVTKRIDLAKRLLLENKYTTVLGLANECGFNNTANFNKAFRKYEGVTPTEYKYSEENIS